MWPHFRPPEWCGFPPLPVTLVAAGCVRSRPSLLDSRFRGLRFLHASKQACLRCGPISRVSNIFARWLVSRGRPPPRDVLVGIRWAPREHSLETHSPSGLGPEASPRPAPAETASSCQDARCSLCKTLPPGRPLPTRSLDGRAMSEVRSSSLAPHTRVSPRPHLPDLLPGLCLNVSQTHPL